MAAWRYPYSCSARGLSERAADMYKGHFKPPKAPANGEKSSGGFRLLMCERPDQFPPGLQLSYTAFQRIEKVFNLSPATLSSLFQISGVYFKSHKLHAHSNEVESLNVVIKANQKVEISNALLSLSHNFETKWTTAFLCGEGVVRRQSLDDLYGYRLDHVLALAKSSIGYWTHPLFLPAALLQNLCKRTEISKDLLNDRLVNLENEIGVTFAGQARHGRSLENWPAGLNIISATIGLHSTSAQIVFVSDVCEWVCGCTRFLLDLGEEIGIKYPALTRKSVELSEYLTYELCSMSHTAHFMQSCKERVQAQINVVGSDSCLTNKIELISAQAFQRCESKR
jgi:hypothetical protein